MERFWLMGYRAMCATQLYSRISVWCNVLSLTTNCATKRDRSVRTYKIWFYLARFTLNAPPRKTAISSY